MPDGPHRHGRAASLVCFVTLLGGVSGAFVRLGSAPPTRPTIPERSLPEPHRTPWSTEPTGP